MLKRHQMLGLAAALLATTVHAAPAKLDKKLMAAATAEAPALAKTLERMIRIESGTGDAEGLAAMATLLETELKTRGATVERVKPTGGIAGDIIVARLAGTGSKKLLLIGHMDTVYQRGTAEKAPFHIDESPQGPRMYGLGASDDKGGLAVILHTLKLLTPADYGTLTISINTDEERGSLGSGTIITELARGQDAVLSFEPTDLPETLIRGTSGTNTVTVTIAGKASHAGGEPEKGMNALVEAANVIALTKDLDEGPSKQRFNWTIVRQEHGVRNIIPDNIVLVGDLRTSSTPQVEAFRAEITRRLSAPSLTGATITTDVHVNRPAFSATPASTALVDRAVAIYASLGQKFVIEPRSGGGTDAAYAALAGVPVLEALGLPGAGNHQGAAEFVYLAPTPRRLYLAAELVRQLGR
jgi:glutamate carboxypeptidase